VSRIRCFVAVDLPPDVRQALGETQQRLKALGVRARWVATEAMHLTVKFLGELEPSIFEAVLDALSAPIAAGGPIQLQPLDLGGFPSTKRSRVVWVGLGGEVASLARAALAVEARVEQLGVARERRPFRPHLTLGRARNPTGITNLEQALATVGSCDGPAFSVDHLVLYESRLRPEGPLHISRLSISLA
jgi:2'-5' RNA ligase